MKGLSMKCGITRTTGEARVIKPRAFVARKKRPLTVVNKLLSGFGEMAFGLTLTCNIADSRRIAD